METSFSSYLPGLVRKVADSIIISPPLDVITSCEFTQLTFNTTTVPVLIFGYERGFQVIEVSDPARPFDIVSQRNTGVSMVKGIKGHPKALLAMLTLFPSSAFPSRIVRLYSCIDECKIYDLVLNSEVQDIACNANVLCVTLVTGSIEIFSTSNFALLNVIHTKRPECVGLTVKFTISNIYLAYTLANSIEQAMQTQTETLTEKLASSLYSFADYGLSTVKSYFDTSGWTRAKATGKITICKIYDSKTVCEFNAFATAASNLKFSPSSHLLVVACESGQNIHVYRINPPLKTRHSESGRHLLIYQLTRGITVAQMSDISFSSDESWLCLSSMRGTNHVYKIDPTTTSLHYNHPVYTRIKSGSVMENQQLAPVCCFPLSDTPQLLRIDTRGKLKLWLVSDPPQSLGFTMLKRKAAFEEMSETRMLSKTKAKVYRDSPDWLDFEMPSNWVPLFKSPQFVFHRTKTPFEQSLEGSLQLEDWEEDLPPPYFMIIHSDPSQEKPLIKEALSNQIGHRPTADELAS
mmetsp:Transcript_27342/g.49191  ORF Transcript_27342/g.49191 Transcript_27342/m.49191 type:complete len:520 (+) Transcript_27342:1314-2873(+)